MNGVPSPNNTQFFSFSPHQLTIDEMTEMKNEQPNKSRESNLIEWKWKWNHTERERQRECCVCLLFYVAAKLIRLDLMR